jgi:hypothetical protein
MKTSSPTNLSFCFVQRRTMTSDVCFSSLLEWSEIAGDTKTNQQRVMKSIASRPFMDRKKIAFDVGVIIVEIPTESEQCFSLIDEDGLKSIQKFQHYLTSRSKEPMSVFVGRPAWEFVDRDFLRPSFQGKHVWELQVVGEVRTFSGRGISPENRAFAQEYMAQFILSFEETLVSLNLSAAYHRFEESVKMVAVSSNSIPQIVRRLKFLERFECGYCLDNSLMLSMCHEFKLKPSLEWISLNLSGISELKTLFGSLSFLPNLNHLHLSGLPESFDQEAKEAFRTLLLQAPLLEQLLLDGASPQILALSLNTMRSSKVPNEVFAQMAALISEWNDEDEMMTNHTRSLHIEFSKILKGFPVKRILASYQNITSLCLARLQFSEIELEELCVGIQELTNITYLRLKDCETKSDTRRLIVSLTGLHYLEEIELTTNLFNGDDIVELLSNLIQDGSISANYASIEITGQEKMNKFYDLFKTLHSNYFLCRFQARKTEFPDKAGGYHLWEFRNQACAKFWSLTLLLMKFKQECQRLSQFGDYAVFPFIMQFLKFDLSREASTKGLKDIPLMSEVYFKFAHQHSQDELPSSCELF